MNYLFEEFHWDIGKPFGTAKPLLLLEAVPNELIEFVGRDNIAAGSGTMQDNLRQYLNRLSEKYLFDELANVYKNV